MKRKLLWAPQVGPQQALVDCPFQEVFFGGARGGGKTDGVLGRWAIKEKRYGKHFNAIMFRRTTVSSEDAIERSKEIYSPLGAKFNETKTLWRMPNGGRVSFRYLESEKDADEWQGRNVTDAWVEEAGHYVTSSPIDRLFGVLRSAQGVPTQLILTANPGGAGQHWLRERYHLAPFPKRPQVHTRVLPNGSTHRYAVIPSRITDNKILMDSDPQYINRLYMVGSAELVKGWLEGDWTAIQGAFFDCWKEARHVHEPFAVPSDWLRFRSMDWGSASPSSIGWWAVVSDAFQTPEGKILPRGFLLRYREWYTCKPKDYARGLKLTAEQIADGIKEREEGDVIGYGVLDPAAFAEDGGPSHAERMNGRGVFFKKADNKRVTTGSGNKSRGAMGGWDMMRQRLIGDEENRPMIGCFKTCTASITTIPALQHDDKRPEDLDTNSIDHCFTEDTLVRTDKGVYSFADLLGTEGHTFSHDGEKHAFRSVRLVKRDQPIVKLTFSDGIEIRCTPDHHFLTRQGWFQASELVGKTTLSLSPTASKSLMGSGITVARNTSSAMASGFIAECGKALTVLCRQASMSITMTMIVRTTRSVISNASRSLSIWATDTAKRLANGLANILIAPALRLLPGTAAMQAASGIDSNMSSIVLRPFTPRSNGHASNAGHHSKAARPENSAQTNASQHGEELQASTMKADPAVCAARNSASTATKSNKHVRLTAGPFPALEAGPVCLSLSDAGSADVYCFTVPDTGNFTLGNGMIATQCADDWRYACMSRPWARSLPDAEPDNLKDYYSTDDDSAEEWRVV